MKTSRLPFSLMARKKDPKIHTSIQLVLFCLLGISIFTFKGGLYLFPILSVLVYLYFRNFSYLNSNSELSGMTKTIVALAITGTITSLLSSEGITSTVDFTRKVSPLFAIPIAFYFFRYKNVRRIFTYSMVIGLLAALTYSLIHYLQNTSIDRLASFWDVGRWGEILSYTFILLLPLAFKKGSKQSCYIIITLLIILLGYIALSGSRAPILVLGITTALYLLIYNRQYFIKSTVIIVCVATLMHFTLPENMRRYEDKVVSIFNVQDEYSNVARLKMWQEAALFAKWNLMENTSSFVFGTGLNKNEQKFQQHLSVDNKLSRLQQETQNQFSTRDHHNAFWNMLNGMGLIYTAQFIFMIGYMLWLSLKKSKTQKASLYQSAFLLLIAYCIFGIFYSNQLSYQTYVMMFLWSFAITYPSLPIGNKKTIDDQEG